MTAREAKQNEKNKEIARFSKELPPHLEPGSKDAPVSSVPA